IWRLGAVPQSMVADALAHCTAEQLDRIEHFNPHIAADNGQLWQTLCTEKYKELRELHERVEQGTATVRSWRQQYWGMRRKNEERAQQIMERVRSRTAEVERERSARRIKVARPAVRAAQGRGARGTSLMCDAWAKTREHMQRLEPARAARPAAPPRDGLPKQPRGALVRSRQGSPAGSPAQTPPHYSPPYLSSASSCSPPHSAYSPPHSAYSPPHSSYSPPHVPDSAAYGRGSYSPKFSVVEDPRPAASRVDVVVERPAAKRRRPTDGSSEPRLKGQGKPPPHKQPRRSSTADRRSQMLPD
ncbi:hypothetical protein GGF43_006276, partial [Coemansia sp. RSA 2618]